MNAISWDSLTTPAYVYDLSAVKRALESARALYKGTGFQVLFSLKACSLRPLLELIAEQADGFAVSSFFEAKLAREVLANQGDVHFTSTGLTKRDVGPISETVDYLSFNSLGQFEHFSDVMNGGPKQGLRINPQLSFVSDDRLDPCRQHSKLGIPLDLVLEAFGDKRIRDNVSGIHLHTNCESSDLSELSLTVQRILPVLEAAEGCLRWINLGGGYMFSEANNTEALVQAIETLCQRFGVKVFVEPGASIVRDAGLLVSSVIDLFESGGKSIAVLDTTVSHAPELFEFQFEPRVIGEQENGRHRYILAGCSCLAGDLFGEHGFDRPLSIGSRVVFAEMGAYTVTKAQMFNGINLPAIYLQSNGEEPELVREFTYEDFVTRHGVRTNACI